MKNYTSILKLKSEHISQAYQISSLVRQKKKIERSLKTKNCKILFKYPSPFDVVMIRILHLLFFLLIEGTKNI